MNQQQRMVPWILWGALLMSQAILAVVAFIEGGKPLDQIDLGKALSSLEEGITPVFIAIGVVTAIASAFVPTMFARMQKSAPTDDKQILQRAFAPFIIGLAMAEVCTVMGFVAATQPPPTPERVLVPAAIAIVVMLVVHPPTEARLRKLGGGS